MRSAYALCLRENDWETFRIEAASGTFTKVQRWQETEGWRWKEIERKMEEQQTKIGRT